MSTLSNPSEIARETLRQLAMRRVAPTPDNYRKLYHEIAGTRVDDNELPEAFVRKLARRLPRDNAERQRHVRQLEQALADDVVDPHQLQQVVRRVVGKWVSATHRRRPMIVPVVVDA